jgi:hypothetical protein
MLDCYITSCLFFGSLVVLSVYVQELTADYGRAALPTPNDNGSRLVYVLSAVFVVVCSIVVALRLYLRHIHYEMGGDDWAVVVNISRPDWQRSVLTT